ncbi:MAG: RNase J family beta-CASP ribonuclease [Nanoarchaeota archaeon]|nr:RNase J family beta-CASP ribonuclease [Nanoarchaeota archaeon]
MIEICAIGGYNEIGKNMTAIKIDDEVVIIDMGLHLDSYIKYTEEEQEDIVEKSAAQLSRVGAIPDDSVIKEWRKKVKAIIPTHAHLDHVGALTFLSNKYEAPILCTPFTGEVIKTISNDEKIKLKNEIKILNVNAVYYISDKIKIEFINMTHSTPQTVMVAVHTPEGIILYANDFKFDNHPTLGKKPNYKRLEELGKSGIKVLICDCTRARQPIKTPSELVAKEMLRDVMLGVDSKGKAVIVTTFASHLARLKSIVEFGKKMNRKIVFFGRSLAKYTKAGENIGLVNFSKEVEIVNFGKQIKKRLKKIEKDGIEKYLLVVTGHQGEPKSTLSKMVDGIIPFKFHSEDHVIFSCTIIPSEINIQNRAELERRMREHGVRIFRDIHASGHASREDLRDLLNLVVPKNIIPAHGEEDMKEALVDLAVEKGYKKGKTVHLVNDGDKISF